MKTYTITAIVEIEVTAENEEDAKFMAEEMGEITYCDIKSVECLED